MSEVKNLCAAARKAGYKLAGMDTAQKNKLLLSMANSIEKNASDILAANAVDCKNYASKTNANRTFLDRLTLNKQRIKQMADGIRAVAQLPDPVGEVVEDYISPVNGMRIKKVRAPLGVVAVIYEARPNVTADVAALTVKSGNACVLRGGSDAIESNRAVFKALNAGEYVRFIDSTNRADTFELLKQGEFVDLVIPRGGDALKHFCLEHASMPVIAAAGGNCHVYIDKSADLEAAQKIVFNAKLQRPSVCNAMEHLIFHKAVPAHFVKGLISELRSAGVEVLENATEQEYKTEFEALKMTVATVGSVEEAIARINANSTKHSEAIVTKDAASAAKFTREVDSAAVYVNCSTRFTDGFEFGLGAEIGISTQKLHARGPVALRELTNTKYVCEGDGLIRG